MPPAVILQIDSHGTENPFPRAKLPEKATFLICTAGGLDWACRGLDQLREPVYADLLRPAGAVDGHGYG
eukprot:COSAG02_NODE_18489_length_935_cov_1.596890_1_plen_68_part_10